MPYWLIPVSLMLPVTYGLDAVRGFLLKTSTLLPINVEIIILVVFMFVMLWGGAQVFYRVERRVRVLGTLGRHYADHRRRGAGAGPRRVAVIGRGQGRPGHGRGTVHGADAAPVAVMSEQWDLQVRPHLTPYFAYGAAS